jgi:hypothetical protein
MYYVFKGVLQAAWYTGISISWGILLIMIHAFYFHYSRSECNWHNFFIDRTCSDTDLYEMLDIMIKYTAFLFFFTSFLVRAKDFS